MNTNRKRIASAAISVALVGGVIAGALALGSNMAAAEPSPTPTSTFDPASLVEFRETVDEAIEAARLLLPKLRQVQDYVWRRHLAANADRLMAATGQGDRRELAVGFVDLVGYTSRSRGMGGRELGAMVEDFESIAAEVIARHHGRVVKTVGDGVLFTAGSAIDAVEIGLALPPAWDADERPPLRVGAAYGAVLTRLGDVYSPVVNLASRLTSLARPGTVLVDRDLAEWLRGHPAYRVRPLRRVSVRGYDHLQPWLVRRRPTGDDPAAPDGYDEDAFDEDDEKPV